MDPVSRIPRDHSSLFRRVISNLAKAQTLANNLELREGQMHS